MSGRILLTNGQLRKTLSSVRSLGKKNIEAFSAEETRMNITGFSKYCTKNLIYPSPDKKPEAFMEWLEETIDRCEIEVYFPMDDAAMALAVKHQDFLSKKAGLTVPGKSQFEMASDKWHSVKMAEKAGLDCPVTILPENMEDLTHHIDLIRFPAIIKPRKSSGSRGIREVNNKSELLEAYQKVSREYPAPILQERIPTGPRFDVCLLFNQKSRLTAAFAQKEIRHFPLEMGPSTVQQSISLPELVSCCGKMLGEIGWTGIAEIEFMLDERTGKYLFMEINPRFWNSLELAVHCGVDFPYYLYQISKGVEPDQAPDYKEGQYCSWLFPGDLLHFIFNKNRSYMMPPLFGGGYDVHDDILSRSDPMPFAGFIASVIRYSLDRHMWKFFFKR